MTDKALHAVAGFIIALALGVLISPHTGLAIAALIGPDGPEALAMMGLSPVEEAVMDKTPHFAAGLPV